MAEPDPTQFSRKKNVFVLCFDGTGNKFSGTEADSNILKLYRMLDRTDANMFTFYQPGIGTYITSTSMQTTTMVGRVRSWYSKAKDSAVGSSFAEHVMGGYQFLMKYYKSEDDLYFFGFSRGAYTARFLAEMLDHIGLLSSGNQELVRFAWKTYSKWAARKNDGSQGAENKEDELYRFMTDFRETFSRPVRRIRFLGLFDTVNSVPRFESAWMERTKFPYTARSSAKVIRHAVSIDERRAKFRQDLISGNQTQIEDRMRESVRPYNLDRKKVPQSHELNGHGAQPEGTSSKLNTLPDTKAPESDQDFEKLEDATPEDVTHLSAPQRQDTTEPVSDFAGPMSTISMEDIRARASAHGRPFKYPRRRWSTQLKSQDIQEVWFAGGHADVGGGWERSPNKGEECMLSHIPLVWMAHEAEKAGLRFDSDCLPERVDDYGERIACPTAHRSFHSALEDSYKTGLVHDCLSRNNGLPLGGVILWKIMEYLPFRRMDLQHDGSWKAISWPLPMGETRDIPRDAQIHHSVIKRMETNGKYRPGNLIIGGGGRGVRKAKKKYGIGEWKLYRDEGDRVRETWVREDAEAEES